MKIGIMGHRGVVGRALFKVFSRKFSTIGYDIKERSSINDIKKTDICFLCLPTPTVNGKQSLVAITSTLKSLKDMNYKGIVVIKSTILPGTTDSLSREFIGLTIINNPEFLSHKTAESDLLKQKDVIIGSGYKIDISKVIKLYHTLFDCNIKILLPVEAEMIKYMHNVYFASKISVLNELHSVCQKFEVDYSKLIKEVSSITGWLNLKHTQVPGPDGEFGFGGTCFPKDFGALLSVTEDLEIPTLRAAFESNKKRRHSLAKGVADAA